MSQSCPLCGKTKPEEALFCEDCARKIHAEYEIDIPDKPQESDTESESELEFEPEPEKIVSDKRRRIGIPLLFVLVIALLAGGFFLYHKTIRKTNQDGSGWEAAVRVNSVEGYLIYMEAHPNGAHFDEAQEALHRLKSEEAAVWEKMKVTNNPVELRDFLRQHSESPYARLVTTRLDSLVWVRAVQINTTDAYSDYIIQAENGDVAGDYIAEARKRHESLLVTPPDETLALDSLSETSP